MSEIERIPVFPLGVVLFPASRIPLHIFEDRYKRLCLNVLKQKGIFGINFIEDQNMHSVGCAARIAEVTKRYPDGKLDIVTEGVRRYEVIKFEQGEPNELSYAQIQWIDDDPEIRDEALAVEVIGLFNELCEVAYKGTVEMIDASMWKSEPMQPSFAVAQKSGLSPEQRQTLLLVKSENQRLEVLKKHLIDLLPRVRDIELINDLIRNDGYIPNWNKGNAR